MLAQESSSGGSIAGVVYALISLGLLVVWDHRPRQVLLTSQ